MALSSFFRGLGIVLEAPDRIHRSSVPEHLPRFPQIPRWLTGEKEKTPRLAGT